MVLVFNNNNINNSSSVSKNAVDVFNVINTGLWRNGRCGILWDSVIFCEFLDKFIKNDLR